MNTLLLGGLQTAYRTGLYPSWRRFLLASRDPEKVQTKLLSALLGSNKESTYGRAHGFDNIRSVREYQDKVPVVDYNSLFPWIDRLAKGEPRVLTSERVLILEESGGAIQSKKVIPYTRSLLRQFSEATHAWLYDVYRNLPGLCWSRSYWSISPATRARKTSEGGIPIGFNDDTEYFDFFSQWVLRKMMAVPPDVVRLANIDEWRKKTLLYLLKAKDLGLISVWSPTFLVQLMKFLDQHIEGLISQLPSGQRERIQEIVGRQKNLQGEALWPRLALISCWTEGPSAHFVPQLRCWFPRVAIQGKGLLATEGVVSFPLWSSPHAVVAASSHFMEFMDVQCLQARPFLCHQLRIGSTYSPLLSTAGGLYRYHLKDRVTCMGFFNKLPILRFDGKLDNTSDLHGEKLNAYQVEQAISSAQKTLDLKSRFSLLSPVRPERKETGGYYLFVESDESKERLRAFGQLVERQLSSSHSYLYCRQLGQLDSIRVVKVKDGWSTYEKTLLQKGQRAGDIKVALLDNRLFWGEVFSTGQEG